MATTRTIDKVPLQEETTASAFMGKRSLSEASLSSATITRLEDDRAMKKQRRIVSSNSVDQLDKMDVANVEDDDVLRTYLRSVGDTERQKDITRLHALVKKHAPDLEPTLEFTNTLGYGKYHYHYKSGRQGDWTKIGISTRKNGLTIHFCAVRDGKYVLEGFDAHSLGKPKRVGKSCIQFSKLSDLNLNLLKKIIETTSKADTMT